MMEGKNNDFNTERSNALNSIAELESRLSMAGDIRNLSQVHLLSNIIASNNSSPAQVAEAVSQIQGIINNARDISVDGETFDDSGDYLDGDAISAERIEQDGRAYRIEHFPSKEHKEIDVVINLDYQDGESQEDIVKILRKNAPGFDGYRFRDLVSSEKFADGKQKYYIKVKSAAKSKSIVGFIHGRTDQDIIGADLTKQARYGIAGVLNEIVLAKKVKEIITSRETQLVAKEYGFEGILFSEPIMAVISKDKNKYLIYENITEPETSEENRAEYLLRSRLNFAFIKKLRSIFISQGISPNDLAENQFMVRKKEGKYYLVLIDTEAYTEIKDKN